MEMTFNRLRRQLAAADRPAARAQTTAGRRAIIAGNTYEHYDEHAADVYQPPPDPDARRRGAWHR